MLPDQLFELRHQLGVAPELELRVDAALLCDELELLEPHDRRSCERLVGEVRERGAAPERQGPAKRR